MDLYGFFSQEELKLFQQLISVSGVGPKAALAILSASSPANLAMSIITGDEKALTRAPGVGKKIAQRVILDLKDKLAKGQSISAAGETISGPAVLGYSQAEINAALKGVDIDGQPLEQIIRLALKNMVKG